MRIEALTIALLAAGLAACVSAERQPKWSAGQTIVQLRSTGHVFVDGVETEPTRIAGVTLERAIADNPQMDMMDIYPSAVIVVCADAEIRYGEVQQILAILRNDGFGTIRLAIAGQNCPR